MAEIACYNLELLCSAQETYILLLSHPRSNSRQHPSRPTRQLAYIRHITSLVANHTAIRHHITSSLANHTAIRHGVTPPPLQPAAAAADARWGHRVTSRRTADRSHSTATSCSIRPVARPAVCLTHNTSGGGGGERSSSSLSHFSVTNRRGEKFSFLY